MESKMAGGYEYELFTPEDNEYYSKYNTRYDKEGNGLVRVGKSRCVLYKHFLTHAEGIRNLEVRSDDVFVITYPRSGTTWTQELVWLINNNLDFEKAKSKNLMERFPFIEFYMFFTPHSHDDFMDSKESRRFFDDNSKPVTEALIAAKSQRFIKSHLHISLLPAATINTAKDLKGTAKRVAQFFGKDYTDQQLDELCDHLAIDNFRTNRSINLNQDGILADEDAFIRKGKAGGWREVFDEEMAQHAERLMKEELQGTGINFRI